MSSSNPNGRHRARSYIRDDTSTVLWAIVAFAAVIGLGLLYFYWDSGAKLADTSSPPSQTTQSNPPGSTGSGSGSPATTPSNQGTTGTTPAR